jgi:transposase InsO family protein
MTMPWDEKDIMTLREEFVALALQDGANRRELCRRFKISPQTAYKWLSRFKSDGLEGLEDRSRRPKTSPNQSVMSVEKQVVELRVQHPAWGGRKISRRLQDLGGPQVAPSTVTSILHRYQLISPEASDAGKAWRRFVHDAPNDLWQMDFKGYFPTSQGQCHPLTVLDDHSRFNLAIQACGNERYATVKERLMDVFRLYGMPVQINTDNGGPWGSPRVPGELSQLGVWLVRLGIRLTFSRPWHPQTNGKDERFHRSLKAEVLRDRAFRSLSEAQLAFDDWRNIYNHQRPHQALQMTTPATHYRMSPRPYPETLPELEYGPEDTVVKVHFHGNARFRDELIPVSKALRGLPIAVRPNGAADGCFDVYFSHHKLCEIDLCGRKPKP